MSEETQNASRSAARGVIMSIVVSAIFGYILALGVTFAIQDIGGVTGAGTFAVKEVYLQALGTRTAEVMLFITVGAQLFCGMASITSASRMLYAFSRDGATPGHRLWRKLNRDRVPAYAVLAIAVLAFFCAFPAYFGPNGVAPSRENAYIILDAEVIDAMPQKSWAPTVMNSITSAVLVPSACR